MGEREKAIKSMADAMRASDASCYRRTYYVALAAVAYDAALSPSAQAPGRNLTREEDAMLMEALRNSSELVGEFVPAQAPGGDVEIARVVDETLDDVVRHGAIGAYAAQSFGMLLKPRIAAALRSHAGLAALIAERDEARNRNASLELEAVGYFNRMNEAIARAEIAEESLAALTPRKPESP